MYHQPPSDQYEQGECATCGYEHSTEYAVATVGGRAPPLAGPGPPCVQAVCTLAVAVAGRRPVRVPPGRPCPPCTTAAVGGRGIPPLPRLACRACAPELMREHGLASRSVLDEALRIVSQHVDEGHHLDVAAGYLHTRAHARLPVRSAPPACTGTRLHVQLHVRVLLCVVHVPRQLRILRRAIT